MGRIPADYFQRVYSGWLGKLIGIRHGAPIEGWDRWKIRDILGEITSYPVDYRPNFAADDDSNGPLFFLRALEFAEDPNDLQPQHVAQALLNFAPYEHGFFWWGGYGISTEHTAYLNLRNGVPAPRSGSIAQNGAAVAEQIGGQIFIDTWGLVAPGNPELAAKLAKSAASAMHDGNGVYGGVYVAVCISLAFVERDIRVILRKALEYIPADCEYARVVRAVADFHAQRGESGWADCFQYIWDNFGYDKYPGNCHIIPNAAVMILAMLYGGGDFVRTINICNMCGWDTDCNVGNVATILGVMTNLQGVDYEKWIRPVNDLLVCSGVLGSLNQMDVPYGASYIAQWAYKLAGEKMPEDMAEILSRSIDGCHFEYAGSTHSVHVHYRDRAAHIEAHICNTDEQARTGKRSLRIAVPNCRATDEVFAGKRTYLYASDFFDSRYDPSFSPLLYPGQRVHASVMAAEGGCDVQACIFVKNARLEEMIFSQAVECLPGQWVDLTFDIPAMDGALLDEAGVCLRAKENGMALAYLDDLYFSGTPEYGLDLSKEVTEVWTPMHREVSQFTRMKGLMYLEDGALHLTGADFAEAYTGRHDWRDYSSKFRIAVQQGTHAAVNFRVQGAMRSYAAGFDGEGNFALMKNVMGEYRTLCAAPLDWQMDKEYEIEIRAVGDELTATCDGVTLRCTDGGYADGGIGISARQGTHVRLYGVDVRG